MVFDFAGNGSCESGRKFPFDSRVRELRGFAIPRHTSQGESVLQFVTQRIVALASRTKQSFSQIQGSERRTNGKMRICGVFWLAMPVGGEVTPVSPIARSLTVAESMTGQLFPAILIGALVAMAMQSRTKS